MNLTKSRKKQLFKALVALILIITGWVTTKYPNEFQQLVPAKIPTGTYQVIEFNDGDTIVVDMGGYSETIRFIGVDTPETHDPRKPIQCFGYAASEFTKNLIGDGPVRLEADPTNSNRDRYDRLLRYIYNDDGVLVNGEIIRQGYGFAYTSFPFQHSQQFKDYERQARAQNLGLWNECKPTLSVEGYISSNPAVETN